MSAGLRQLAEAAKAPRGRTMADRKVITDAYIDAATPTRVLALLDKVAAVEALCESWSRMARDGHEWSDALTGVVINLRGALGAAGDEGRADDGCTFHLDGTCKMPEDQCSNAGECLWDVSPGEYEQDVRDQEDFDAREGRL